MPNLAVVATKSTGVIGYTLFVDANLVNMNYGNDTGTVPVSGACGDGSKHQLLYTFEGAAGDTLSVVMTCAGVPVCHLKQAKITPTSAPLGGGRKDFSL